MVKQDYLFRGSLEALDPDVAELIRHETARQAAYLIMIPSESTIPEAVRQTLASAFHNIYAEGYPASNLRTMSQSDILDYDVRLPEYRRRSDQRYYKGTDYANIVESLAQRRTAEVFAANGYKPEQLYINVQPLSGAPANNAVYTALLNVGDTVMGMDLIEGGHLTHGSPVNRSGKFYNIVSYGIDPNTGDIDYAQMMDLTQQYKPRMIIGGYSSFPYVASWEKYREIADSVGAYLLADVAHVAGLIAGGVYPSPVGIADVVTFTTHKTLGGPRGAIIITHRKDLATKIDRGVFPGEQGGPHVNAIAAMAVAMKLTQTEQFKDLQHQTVANAILLADRLAKRGLTIAYNGTNTHLLNVDLRAITGPDGTSLSGDMGARLLDLAGIVANRQTIPGDRSALRPSGIRLGTPWITQRGFGQAEIEKLANIIADLLLAAVPYSLPDGQQTKIEFEVFQDARLRVRNLAASVGIDTDVEADGYPHFDYLEPATNKTNWQTLRVTGHKAASFLDIALTSDVYALKDGQSQPTTLLKPTGEAISSGTLEQIDASTYDLHLERNAGYVATWLRSLSEGFILLDPDDPHARISGPVTVQHTGPAKPRTVASNGYMDHKPYFIGVNGQYYAGPEGIMLPRFEWQEEERNDLLTTTLYNLHKKLGAKTVPFAGYDMPVWYTSVTEEHLAARQHAGLFDVTHMGVFDMRGPGAARFLDTVTTNDVIGLKVGSSHYTYLLDVNGVPLDDLMIYRLDSDHFLMVVNASNNDKNWAWLKAVKNHEVMIDPAHPARTANEGFIIRDLRKNSASEDMRVNVALQGPKSKDILLALDGLDEDKQAIAKLKWASITQVNLGGFDLIISRTGYTGERVAYEIFVHPDHASALFQCLIDLGAVPCGLAARDSLRTEAGLPLYGNELAGDMHLDPMDAGFGNYVKTWKPFFVGRDAYMQREHEGKIVRFRLENKRARPPHHGDPLVDDKGRVVGIVTSCSIDSEGYQLGQAYVQKGHTKSGTQLGVFAGSGRSKPMSFEGVGLGKRLVTPEPVTILTRFPKR